MVHGFLGETVRAVLKLVVFEVEEVKVEGGWWKERLSMVLGNYGVFLGVSGGFMEGLCFC